MFIVTSRIYYYFFVRVVMRYVGEVGFVVGVVVGSGRMA